MESVSRVPSSSYRGVTEPDMDGKRLAVRDWRCALGPRTHPADEQVRDQHPRRVRAEWHDRHTLSPTSLGLLHDCADPGDAHPISTAVDLLSAGKTAPGG